MPQNRDERGRFPKGQSGNPGGRPKSFASYVRERTGDGQELVDFALETMRDTSQAIQHRLDAMKWLSDRGFGKPTQTQQWELRTWDREELREYAEQMGGEYGLSREEIDAIVADAEDWLAYQEKEG